MRVLFLANAKSIHTVRWVNELSNKGIEVHLVYKYDDHPNENTINKNIKLYRLKYSGTKGYYLNKKELKKRVKEIKPDIINAHYASGYGTLARISKLTPLVLSVWGSDVYDFPYESKLKNKIVKKNLNYATKIASTSYVMANQTRKVLGIKDKDIAVTPFGVDLNFFKFYDLSKKEESEKIKIGMVKALEKKYGVHILIDAIKELLSSHKISKDQISVSIYGDGSEKDKLNKKIKEEKLESIIKLKGRIPYIEVPKVIKDFDIFTVPSTSESFGVAAVEAMAVGIPVVSSDADGFTEVMIDGKTGYIVPKNNSKELARRIYELLVNKELRIKLGLNGREHVSRLYEFSKNVNSMIQLYTEVIKEYEKKEK